MTEPQDDTPYLDALEPAARHTPDRAALSQAISLRRIADALEQLATPVTGTVPASVLDPSLDLQLLYPGTAGDGWRDWHGGDLPVPDNVRVDVRYRDMADGEGLPNGLPADNYWWAHSALTTHRADIVAWRLAR